MGAVELPDDADVLPLVPTLAPTPLVVFGPAVPVVVAVVAGEVVVVVPAGTQLVVAALPLVVMPALPGVPVAVPLVPLVPDWVPAGVPLLLLVVGCGAEGLDWGAAGAALGVDPAGEDEVEGFPMVEVAPLLPVAVPGAGVVPGAACGPATTGVPGAPVLPALPVWAKASAALMQLTSKKQSSLFKIAPRDLSSFVLLEPAPSV